MFIESTDYLKSVEQLLKDDNDIICAVAFWGRGAEKLFSASATTGRKIKVICNLQSGATNPDVITELRKYAEIRQHNSLHAKVISGKSKAIVGSANFSGNGLNFEEEEVAGWEEAGIVTTDPDEISKIQTWFKALWESSEIVTNENIEDARRFWEKRRGSRKPIRGNADSILDFSITELKDRPIYVVISRNPLSEEAQKTIKTIRKDLSQKLGRPVSERDFDCYENWPNLPENAYLIDIHHGPKGGLYSYGLWKRDSRHDRDDRVQTCWRVHNIFDYRFRNEDAQRLISTIRPVITKIWENGIGDEDGFFISLADALEIASQT
jgi:hypothetical protein